MKLKRIILCCCFEIFSFTVLVSGRNTTTESCLQELSRRDDADGRNDDTNTLHVDYFPVGKGNRFARKRFPRGIGSTPNFHAASILSLMEVETALKRMQKAYPDRMKLATTGIKTHEGRSVYFTVLGSSSRPPRVFLVGGTRGRDRGGPDYLVYLISDLLWADRHNSSLRYGGREYGVDKVRRVLDHGLALIPLANPDGVHYDLMTGSCWRKNRRPRSSVSDIGVEIDANFEAVWHDERLAQENATRLAMARTMSRDRKRLHLVEPEHLPEPEMQSIYNVLRDVTSVSWYLDVHSVQGQVVYTSARGEVDHRQKRLSLSGRYRDRFGGRGTGDNSAERSAAHRMVRAMNSVGDEAFYRAYEAAAAAAAAAATTTTATASSSSSSSAHCLGPNRINALRLIFGKHVDTRRCQDYFYPDAYKYHQNMLQTTVGLMEFLLNAAEGGGEGDNMFRC
ncbi:hypothetical protein CP532_0631 [Ophiocordyceps camponoti-leonardi (nom. inval.)]|nr:hypothetical protein CP532_0631 [Ophiocordyceps camponoti-leonardi (nom. inval.)]